MEKKTHTYNSNQLLLLSQTNVAVKNVRKCGHSQSLVTFSLPEWFLLLTFVTAQSIVGYLEHYSFVVTALLNVRWKLLF